MLRSGKFPAILFPLIFGLIFSSLGVVFGVVFGQTTSLNCTRVETTLFRCEKETRWMGKIPIGSQSIPDLRGATVEGGCDSDDCTYRVALLTTDNALLPLTDFYTTGKTEKEAIVAEITRFVQDKEQHTVSITGDAGLVGMLLPLIFVGIGLLIAGIGTVVILKT